MNYTKGEWVMDGLEIVVGYVPDQDHIASIDECNENYEGNARLIASAPDMYEALKNLIASFRDTPLFATDVVTDALAAIRKAEGK